MSRSPEYDKDIAEMYGTADPSILFEVSEDKRIARAMGFGYAYYPQNDPLPGLIDSLFGNGEQGAMHIPNPRVLGQQVLWQDVEGTVPVVSDGDPVGLMLDLSRGLELGPELVTNGTFDEGLSGWVMLLSSASVIDGSAVITASDVNGRLEQIIPTTPNVPIVVEWDVVSGTQSGGQQVRIGTGSSYTDLYYEEVPEGRTSIIITPTASQIRLGVYPREVDEELIVDNISVRELPGNHATQSTSAARPIYRTDGVLQQYDGVDDEMNVTLPSIAEATVITATASGVDVQYPVDLSGGSYTITESHSGTIIREGELSSEEQQRAVDYLSSMPGVTL